MTAAVTDRKMELSRRAASPGFLGTVGWAGSLITRECLHSGIVQLLKPTQHPSASESEVFKTSVHFVPFLAGVIMVRHHANHFTLGHCF